MQTLYYPASERGHVNFGWLDSYHSFSFGNWYDSEKVHFGALRVLNDDVVKGGKGFDTHPHENMEIVSIPLKGALKHQDNTGTEEIIYSGDVQIISVPKRSEGYDRAERATKLPEGHIGIRHSEFNASHYDPVNFLQIWVFPKQQNISPRHERRRYDAAAREGKWQVVVSPVKEEGGLWINQDARFAMSRLPPGGEIVFPLTFKGSGLYLFVIEGSALVEDRELGPRDAIGIWETDNVTIRSVSGAELLAIEVPMFA